MALRICTGDQAEGQSAELVAASVEEIAAWLSVAEGRVVTIHEVRRIEFEAMRKIRQALKERGITPADLLLWK